MNQLDKYGQGRKSVIEEMITFCDNEIEKINEVEISTDTHKNATLRGQKNGFIKVRQKLNVKLNRLKEL